MGSKHDSEPWKLEPGARPAERRGLQRDRTTVQLGEIADDRETEPRSPDLLVGPHSPLQHLSAHGWIEARPVVIHRDRELGVVDG